MEQLFVSKRVSFNTAYYYTQITDENIVNREELVHNTEYDGKFRVQEENGESDNQQQIGGVFLFERRNITLKTYANIYEKLKRGDLILYKKNVWIVSDIRRDPLQRRNQYNKKDYFITYIDLRR